MGELRVNNCCGCISLRAGTTIIAVLATIGAFAILILVSATAFVSDYLFPAEDQEMHNRIEYREYRIFRELYLKIAFPYAVILIFVNSSLLLGVIKSKRGFMLPYLILNGSLLVIYTFLIAILAIAFPIILGGLLIIAIPGYFLLVVYSHYKSLAYNPQVQVLFKHQA